MSPEALLIGPLPEGASPQYFNAAPIDSAGDGAARRRGAVLENLHPEWPEFFTRLPGVRPRAFLLEGKIEVHLTFDTLWIDTDWSICTLTSRGQIALSSAETAVRLLVEPLSIRGARFPGASPRAPTPARRATTGMQWRRRR